MFFIRKFYYYCIVQYFLCWPIRLLVFVCPLFCYLFVLVHVGSVLVLAEEPVQSFTIVLTDGQQEQIAIEAALRDELKNSEFLNRDFSFTNLEDRGETIKVNYTEELRPYMFKKHMVDIRDHQILRDLDNPKPRKPLKDYMTAKNLAIGVVVFIGSMIFLGWLDEQMEGEIMEDLKFMRRRNEEHIAREWAIRVDEWSARWLKVKAWFGNPPQGGQ